MKETFLLTNGLSKMIKTLLLVFVLVGIGQVANAQATMTTPEDAALLMAQDLSDAGLLNPADAATTYEQVKVRFIINMAKKMKDLVDLGTYTSTDPVAVTEAFITTDTEQSPLYIGSADQVLIDNYAIVKAEVQTLLSIF
jgi:hypothetical protein